MGEAGCAFAVIEAGVDEFRAVGERVIVTKNLVQCILMFAMMASAYFMFEPMNLFYLLIP